MKRQLSVLALGVCVSAAADPLVRIDLLPAVKLSGDMVLLGQVAHLRSGDLELLRKLVFLPLGRAPQAGQLGVLQRDGLSAWVQRQVGLGADAIAWTGAEQSRVQRSAQHVAGELLAQAAIGAVRDALAMVGSAAQVHVRVVPRDVELGAADLRIQARPLDAAQLRRRAVVWVDLWHGTSVLRSVPVSVDIARDPEALLVRATEAPPSSAGASVAVVRGEWAVLRASAGAVSLETRVEVLQDGRTGEKVRVRQPGAAGLMFARVTGPGQLELAP